MNQVMWGKQLVVGVAIVSVFVGIAAGFFAAHRMMGNRSEMTGHEMEGLSMKGMADMGDMKGMPMEGAPSMRGKASMPGTSDDPSRAVAVPAVARQLIGVRSAVVTHATLEEEIRTVGTVGYDERGFTQVTLKTSGWVRKVFVDSIGRPVRKDEPLFTLYSPDLLATQDEYLLALKTRAQLSESPLDDAKANADTLVASTRERLRLWDVTDTQIAALEHRGKAEPILTVYAPSSGIVMKRDALPGTYVEPGTILYEIADLSTVWIYADIYESEVVTTKVGQTATVTVAAYPGETFRGTVAYIYPTLNTQARTVQVRLEFPNRELKLKPGMYGTVTLQTDAVRTLVVPKEAVIDTGLRQLVFMDRGQGRYEPASVKVGRRTQDAVEVLEGLNEGDRIVTSANFLLDAESKLASASSMQSMMGRIGMGDWQMRGAYEAKREGREGREGMSGMQRRESMKGMERMQDMNTMSGMDSGSRNAAFDTRKVAGHLLTFTTLPETPKAGQVLLRLKVTDQKGKPVTTVPVTFAYTMPMPEMAASKAAASPTKDGVYEAPALFGMGGTWVVTATVTIPGQPPVIEQFQVRVTEEGM